MAQVLGGLPEPEALVAVFQPAGWQSPTTTLFWETGWPFYQFAKQARTFISASKINPFSQINRKASPRWRCPFLT
jgi:hypothetical protein